MSIQERIPKVVYQLRFQSKDEQGIAFLTAVLLNLGYSEGDLVVCVF
jgi:hypothetical protein